MSAFPLAVFGAALLAIGAAGFGVGVSRLAWASDLRRAEELRLIWDRTEQALRNTIESQNATISALKGKRP